MVTMISAAFQIGKENVHFRIDYFLQKIKIRNEIIQSLTFLLCFVCSIVNYAAEMGARFADNVSSTLQTGSRLKLEASGKSAAFRHFRFQRQAPGVGRLSRLAIIGGACGKVLRAQLLGPYAR